MRESGWLLLLYSCAKLSMHLEHEAISVNHPAFVFLYMKCLKHNLYMTRGNICSRQSEKKEVKHLIITAWSALWTCLEFSHERILLFLKAMLTNWSYIFSMTWMENMQDMWTIYFQICYIFIKHSQCMTDWGGYVEQNNSCGIPYFLANPYTTNDIRVPCLAKPIFWAF